MNYHLSHNKSVPLATLYNELYLSRFIITKQNIFKMQKKKSENKLNFPSVGLLKPTQNSKCYTSKANLNKFREVEQKNIYFEMPSIHQNDLTMKTFMEAQDRGIKKIQLKILKFYEQFRDAKMTEEWDLYIKKSQILNSRMTEFSQIQEFLLKNTYKQLAKINQTLLQNTFSFNKSKISQSDASYLKQEFSGILMPDQYKTLLLEKSLNQKDFKAEKNGFRSTTDDKSRFAMSGRQQAAVDPISALNHQNALLDKKAELFQRRIIQLEQQLEQFEMKQKGIDKQRDVTSQLMTAITLKNKYRHDSQVKTLQLSTLNEDLANSKKLNETYQAKLASLQSSYKECKDLNIKYQEYLKYKELWMMSTEQTRVWRVLYDELKEENAKLMSKVKMLKDKNKQLLNYFNMSNAVNPDQQEDKQYLDKIIKEFKQWLMIMSVPKANVSQPSSNEAEQFTIHDSKSTEVGLKLLRPNFYVFFEAFEHTLLMEKNIINIRPVQYHFFLKIRSIFDTMYNHFQVATSYKEYPNFPEYVIGFLEKYQINSATNLVEYRKKPIQNEEKLTFLVNLFNKNFCNTWECDIFKNFLLENYTLDEVYFFLDCRNQLNSGISATHALGSTDPISFVKLSKALKLVAKKLAPYQNYIIQRVKTILKSKKKIKYGESFIDKHFVLKLLLQVYGLQKSKSQRVFQFSFKSKMKKSYITFGDFHNFMCKNFSFLSSVQIAQLYRQAYTLSSGHLTYKAIHYICGVKGLFIPLMLARRINKNMFEQTLNNDMLLLDIQNSLTKMNGHFEEIGVQNFMRTQLSINNFMRQLDWYKNNKSAFYQRFAYQASQMIKINIHFFLKSSCELTLSETLEDSEIQNHMIQLHSLIHQTDTQVHFLSKQKEKRSKAMTMLIRNFKIRIQQSMQEFQKVNEEQILKLKDQIQRSPESSKLQETFIQMSQTMPS